MSSEISPDSETLAGQIVATRQDAFRVSKKIQDRAEQLVDLMTTSGAPTIQVGMEMRVLQIAQQIVERSLKVRRYVTGMDTAVESEDLPELVITVLTQEEIEQIQAEHSMHPVALPEIVDTSGEAMDDAA